MTTDRDGLLEKIWKSRETYCECKVAGFSTSCSLDDKHPCPICVIHFALRAVVELSPPATFGIDASLSMAWHDGYNYRKEQDLEVIAKELGNEKTTGR